MVEVLIDLVDTIVKRLLPSVLKVVRLEISALVLKMLIGVIISSVLIFSIIQILTYYMIWLEPIETKSLIPFLLFGILISSCIILLYLLFKRKDKEAVPLENSEDSMSLLVVFGQGFLDGFNSKRFRDDEK